MSIAAHSGVIAPMLPDPKSILNLAFTPSRYHVTVFSVPEAATVTTMCRCDVDPPPEAVPELEYGQ